MGLEVASSSEKRYFISRNSRKRVLVTGKSKQNEKDSFQNFVKSTKKLLLHPKTLSFNAKLNYNCGQKWSN